MTRTFDILPNTADALSAASGAIADLVTPTVRLGVTGLARSGKTVFITALVRALTEGARLPFFSADAERRIVRAYLEPQPDDALPRFEYETHIAALTGNPAHWPQSTRRISQLRVTIEFIPRSKLRRWLGVSRLHVDIVDYPGEWLLDLALLDQTFERWSTETLAVLRAGRGGHADTFLSFLAGLDPAAGDPEQTALAGSRLYAALLAADRACEEAQATLGPGRFLMPGDLEGSPLLTFFPLDLPPEGTRPGPLSVLLARRYESYRAKVVTPFFRDHFQRLDRQIVLVDALGAVNRGADAMADLNRALTGVLRAFRPGARGWLRLLTGTRIDRVLFAATKADHLHHTNHDRLEAILRRATDTAADRVRATGANVAVLAIAAVRATREGTVTEERATLPVLLGRPLPGERIDGRVFDGTEEAGIFPGDLPLDAALVFDPAWARAGSHAFVRFRPPPIPDGGSILRTPLPHIRLDRALEILIGDKLA